MSLFQPRDVVRAVRSVVGEGFHGLHEPRFGLLEESFVLEAIRSTFVSSVGKFVDSFEDEVAHFTGAKHAVAVTNGTSALHIALKLAGVGSDDEVLIPALSFVATANAVVYCGAIPHFVDSEDVTLGVDANQLRAYLKTISRSSNRQCINTITGRKIKALVPMHTFGHPCDLGQLMEVANEFGLVLVEDAAESLGSLYGSRHTGTFGLAGVLSFNGNKVITTGGGGIILTNDTDLAVNAKHITTTAKMPHKWEFDHDQIGYNYRLPNINAALGYGQMKSLEEKILQKRALFSAYAQAFEGIEGIKLFKEPNGCRSNYWLQTLILATEDSSLKEETLELLNSDGIMARPAWKLLSSLKPFASNPRMPLKYSESLSRRIINIPSSPHLMAAHGI
jgi:aminotransferase in exopolysaccharide biosynthesis